MQKNTSPTQSGVRKTRIGNRSPRTYSLFPSAMLAYGGFVSDVHAFIKEPTIKLVEHRSEIHSNEPQHLAGGMEVARFRR